MWEKIDLAPKDRKILGWKNPDWMELVQWVEDGEYFVYCSDGDGPVEGLKYWMEKPEDPITT